MTFSTIVKYLLGLVPVSITIPIQSETISIPVAGVATFEIVVPAFSITLKKG